MAEKEKVSIENRILELKDGISKLVLKKAELESQLSQITTLLRKHEGGVEVLQSLMDDK
tara:strand:- start:1748 stop:1924 length:177 start_codon:yes stop_codon:yes gene_type:complete